jgi:hypothetical protein
MINLEERTYCPSKNKVVWNAYILPAVGAFLVFTVLEIISLVQGQLMPRSNLITLVGFYLSWIGMNILQYGLRAEHLALTVTSSSVAGPVRVGRAVPISFDQIDYQKTLEPKAYVRFLLGKRIFGFEGDQIVVHEALFRPEEISEIWGVIEKAAQEHKG